MNLTISSLYPQPGVAFNISHKVIRCIEQILNKVVMPQYCASPGDKNWSLSLIISTKKECKTVEAKGPDRDKRNKCLTWGLWLPYFEIVQSNDLNCQFIRHFFEAAQQAFSFYGIKSESIENARAEIEKEIIGNKEYEYSEAITPIDLSQLKI